MTAIAVVSKSPGIDMVEVFSVAVDGEEKWGNNMEAGE
jgi:hypothetical protein